MRMGQRVALAVNRQPRCSITPTNLILRSHVFNVHHTVLLYFLTIMYYVY